VAPGRGPAAPAGSLRPWRKDPLVFGAPYIGKEERREIEACLDSGWIGRGPRVQLFEERFRRYLGAPAAAVSSGTAALHLAIRELGLPAGSEVITSAMTFCATANVIVNAGLKPVFADCDPLTWNITPESIREKVTPRTRAVVPVHFAGRPCDMPGIMKLARAHRLRVVEDCAHAIESTIGGRHCGTFGDFGCFSFYVTKNLTTVEGGMVVCPTGDQAEHIRRLALHGMSKDAWGRFSEGALGRYEVLEPGFNYSLTDLAASIGIHQLARLPRLWSRRRRIWRYYCRALAALPLVLPSPVPPGVRHAYHLYTCLVDDRRTTVRRDEILRALHRLRIGCGVHYAPLHLQPYYRRSLGGRRGDLPHAEQIGARTFSIPLSGAMTDEDAQDVVRALRMILGGS